MLITDANMRRESRTYFRRAADDATARGIHLAEQLRGSADELNVDGYLSDAAESVRLLREAAGYAERAARLAAQAEAQLPPVVR